FLTGVLLKADPDPWRQKVRQAFADKDQAALKKLVQQAELNQQPPGFLIGLSHSLPLPERIALLRRAQLHHPADFWVNFAVVHALHQSALPGGAGPKGQGKKSPELDEASRFYTAALALRPQSVAVHNNLGLALAEHKDLDGAIAVYRKAIALDPKNPT